MWFQRSGSSDSSGRVDSADAGSGLFEIEAWKEGRVVRLADVTANLITSASLHLAIAAHDGAAIVLLILGLLWTRRLYLGRKGSSWTKLRCLARKLLLSSIGHLHRKGLVRIDTC